MNEIFECPRCGGSMIGVRSGVSSSILLCTLCDNRTTISLDIETDAELIKSLLSMSRERAKRYHEAASRLKDQIEAEIFSDLEE